MGDLTTLSILRRTEILIKRVGRLLRFLYTIGDKRSELYWFAYSYEQYREPIVLARFWRTESIISIVLILQELTNSFYPRLFCHILVAYISKSKTTYRVITTLVAYWDCVRQGVGSLVNRIKLIEPTAIVIWFAFRLSVPDYLTCVIFTSFNSIGIVICRADRFIVMSG